MSSGDESDNVDLTDGETSDSDWSDTGEFMCRCGVNYRSVTSILQSALAVMESPPWDNTIALQITTPPDS
jgi:hypothetical protein